MKTFAIATLAIALLGTAVTLSATSAGAGPIRGGGFMGVSGLDLGSGR